MKTESTERTVKTDTEGGTEVNGRLVSIQWVIREIVVAM